MSSLTFLVIVILVLPLKLHKHEHGRNDLPSQDPDLAPARILILYETISPNFWITGFERVLNGEYDHIPEVAFYMVGHIEEVDQKAARLAEEQS